MAISSRLPGNLADLARALGAAEGVPVLALRVPGLERLAWRQGRAAARRLERRCLESFMETGRRVLRAGDMLAHDDESEVFVAALAAPPREREGITPMDCRAALLRLSSAMERAAGVEVESGWTTVRNAAANDPRLTAAVEAALERGARERERYAFFSGVGHELRTPLTSIRGYLDTLLGEPLDAATTQRFLEIARAEALRLGHLVEGMFALSLLDLQEHLPRGEAGACDLAQALRAAIDAVAPTARLREARVRLRDTSGEPVRAAGSFERVAQTAVNLIDNALKHAARGGCVEVSVGRGEGVSRRCGLKTMARACRRPNATRSSLSAGVARALAALAADRACHGAVDCGAHGGRDHGGGFGVGRRVVSRAFAARGRARGGGGMKRGEEGFTLIEALVSVGMLSFAAMGFFATVLVALHVVNAAKVNDAMDVIAHNALIDLYAVSAYDDGATASLLGQTRVYTVTEQAGSSAAGLTTYTVNVRVYPEAAGEVDAVVQVSDALGNTTAMHGILAQAAPAPGSTFTPAYMPPGTRQSL